MCDKCKYFWFCNWFFSHLTFFINCLLTFLSPLGGKGFLRKNLFDDHVLKDTCDNNSNGIKAEPVKCTDCDETFSGKRYFLQHYRAIHGGLPEHSKDNFMCDQCPNTYVSQLSLKKHISTGKKKPICLNNIGSVYCWIDSLQNNGYRVE